MADCLNNEQQINSNLSESNVDALTSSLDGASSVTSEMSGESLISSTMASTDATTSNLGSEEPLNSQLDLPITYTYKGSEMDNIVITVDNKRLVISAILKQLYGNDIKLASDNDGGLTDAIINTNRRIDNLSFADIDELWNGSLVGGNTLNINVSGYKYLICFVSSIATFTRGITILDVNHTNEQCCVPYGNWGNDNHIFIVRHAFYVSEDKQSITYNNRICYQIGSYIDNHQTNTLVKILGVK